MGLPKGVVMPRVSGDKMAKHNADAAKAQEAAMKDFIRNAGGTGTAER